MCKERKVILILDIIFTILMAINVIVNIYKGRYGSAIVWNMNFILWICNTALNLVFGQIEKIIAKLKEEDKEK